MKDHFLYKLWFSPIPGEHLLVKSKTFKDYFYKFFIHPVKRRVAKYYLVLLRLFGLKVVGITGSAGKTTTKEMLASILGRVGETKASIANIDPVYNIPTTILKCTPLTRFLVLEMGVEYPGEMDYYLWLGVPDIGLITNVYPTHTEFFKTVEAVAVEKGKLAQALGKKNCVVLNKESTLLRNLAKRYKAKTIWYGKAGEVESEEISFPDNMSTTFTLVSGKDKLVVHLPTLGEQFVSNALGASAVALCLGVNLQHIKEGLEGFKPPEHRMSAHILKEGGLLLDDTYNNNPEAAKEALKTLKSVAGQKKMVVVFGDMLELGSLSHASHRQLGERIGSMGVDFLVGVGPLSRELIESARQKMGERAVWVKNEKEVLPLLRAELTGGSVTLVKGSRAIGLDRLVAKLI